MIETISLIIVTILMLGFGFIMFILCLPEEKKYTAEPSSDKKEESKVPAIDRIKEVQALAKPKADPVDSE